MTEFNRPTPEDEAFDHIERMNRVKQSFEEEMQMRAKAQQKAHDELRNGIVEEVALHVEKLQGFGKDTIDSLTVYIREMKK